MKNLDHALAAAEAGFFVFPCVVDGKEPACAHGHKAATRDPARIRELWHNPDFNIAINPGMSGHAVVDIDPPLGTETLNKAIADEGATWPETRMHRSPRGGLHYVFDGACRSALGKSGIGENVDVKSNDGYVLWPPSTVGGKQYVEVGFSDPAPTPEFVGRRTAPKIRSPRASTGEPDDQPHNVEIAKGIIRACHPRQGAGADAEVLKCFYAVRDYGISGETAFDLMLELLDIEPRDDRLEAFLTRKRDNAYHYAQNEGASRANEDPAKVFGDAISKAEAIPAIPIDKDDDAEDQKNPDGKNRFYCYSLGEAQSAFQDPAWLIPQLLPARDTAIIFGPPKSFKTFLLLDMCLGLAGGVMTFGYTPPRKHCVIYIAGEGPSSIGKKHAPAWLKVRGKDGADLDFYIVRRIVNADPHDDTGGTVEKFIAQVIAQGLKPDVVVIDTMARATLGLEENSSKDMGFFVKVMDKIKNSLNCTVIAVHHSGKDLTKGSRGSNAVEGAVATVLQVERHQKSLAVKMTVKEQRDAPEREEPFYFIGNSVDLSLVFNVVSFDEYAKLVKVDKKTGQKQVFAALETLKAFGELASVSTTVLATTIEPTEIAGSKVINELERALRKEAAPGGPLEAYSEGRGQAMKWFIPATS